MKKKRDSYQLIDRLGNKLHEIPIIVNAQNFVDASTKITFERVNIPFSAQNAYETMEERCIHLSTIIQFIKL